MLKQRYGRDDVLVVVNLNECINSNKVASRSDYEGFKKIVRNCASTHVRIAVLKLQ